MNTDGSRLASSLGPQEPAGGAHRAHASARRRIRVRVVAARAVLTVVLLAGAITSLLPGGRAGARGALLLWPLLTSSQPQPFVTVGEGVRHTALTITAASGPVYLDVYEPEMPVPPVPGERGGMLFIPGVGDNRTVPQLINLSESLARSGEVVMEMTTPALIAYDLAPTDSDAVVAAFQRLATWPGVGRDRAGIIGLSGGAALACLAAVDPRVRDHVAFVMSFGGYYDATHMLRDFGRRAIEENGHSYPWTPDTVPLYVLATVLAHRLPEPDATELPEAFTFDNPTPLTSDDVARLSPEGEAAYHVLAGDQPDRVDANIATLVPAAGDLLTALSPSSVLSQIRAPVYLLHDRGDRFVPFTEAQDFAAALTRIHHRYDFVEVGIIAHTEVRAGQPLGSLIKDGAGLGRLLYELLLVGS